MSMFHRRENFDGFDQTQQYGWLLGDWESGLASCVSDPCSHTGPCAVMVLKFFILFEQGTLYFHFALSSTNYMARTTVRTQE